jgi:ketohexokinase
LKISVELEKPGREGLQELALEGDVVFYSRSWAEGEGYSSAEVCLREQVKKICDHASSSDTRHVGDNLLLCTWGSSGACATSLASLRSNIPAAKHGQRQAEFDITCSSAYISPNKPVVDTTGAGDTFIAGVLFGLICKTGVAELSEPWSIKRTLDFANELAGRKILQQGFRVCDVSIKAR